MAEVDFGLGEGPKVDFGLDRPAQPRQSGFETRRAVRRAIEEEEEAKGFVEGLMEGGGAVASDLWEGVQEFPMAALGGVRDAVNSIKTLLEENTRETLAQMEAFGEDQQSSVSRQFNIPDLPPVDEPESVTGKVSRDLTQFFVGFLPLTKAFKTAQAASNTGRILGDAGVSVLTDMALFDAQERKLADVIQDVPSLRNPVTEALASNPDDAEWEGRLKSAVQNAGLGVLADQFVVALKILKTGKSLKAAQQETKVRRLTNEAIERIKPGLSPRQRQQFRAQQGDPEALKHVGLIDDIEPGQVDTSEMAANIRLDKFDVSSEAKDQLKDLAKQNDEFMAQRGVVPDLEVEMRALEKTTGKDRQDFSKFWRGALASDVQALRMSVASAAEDAHEKALIAFGGSDQSLVDLIQSLERLKNLEAELTGTTAELGRSFRVLRRKVAGPDLQEELRSLIKQQGGREHVETIAKLLGELNTPSQMMRGAKEALEATFTDQFIEGWKSLLLSGPQTHAVNISSNSLTGLWTIPERGLAGTLGLFSKGPDKVRGREVLGMMLGLLEGAKEGMRLGHKAFKTEIPTDPLTKIEARSHQAIPSKVFREGKNKHTFNVFGRDIAIPFTGEVTLGGRQVRLPFRALMAEDEFFKSIGRRMELNAQAYRQGLNQGKSGRDLAEFVRDFKNNPPFKAKKSADEFARHITFTEELGAAGSKLQGIVNDIPVLHLIFPFVRTPINIVKFGLKRTPAAPIFKDVRQALKAGGPQAQMAMSRMILGSSFMATMAHFAGNGQITGQGPADAEARALKYQTGWQPYSILGRDGRYYAYNRLEPLGMLMGMAADFAEISGHINKGEADDLAKLILGAAVKNITNKTFLKGLFDTVEAFLDPDRYGDKWFLNYMGTLIPTGVAQIARTGIPGIVEGDPILRQFENTQEKLRSRIPTYSKTLLPRRNIWGDVIELEGGWGPDLISPIYVSSKVNDPVVNAMEAVNFAPALPQKNIGGVKLTPKQYDTYLQLSGRPAKQLLDRIVNTPAFKAAPDEVQKEVFRGVISDFRKLARAQMLANDADLRGKFMDERLKKAGIKKQRVTIDFGLQ